MQDRHARVDALFYPRNRMWRRGSSRLCKRSRLPHLLAAASQVISKRGSFSIVGLRGRDEQLMRCRRLGNVRELNHPYLLIRRHAGSVD
jgi:hypothetical protein